MVYASMHQSFSEHFIAYLHQYFISADGVGAMANRSGVPEFMQFESLSDWCR